MCSSTVQYVLCSTEKGNGCGNQCKLFKILNNSNSYCFKEETEPNIYLHGSICVVKHESKAIGTQLWFFLGKTSSTNGVPMNCRTRARTYMCSTVVYFVQCFVLGRGKLVEWEVIFLAWVLLCVNGFFLWQEGPTQPQNKRQVFIVKPIFTHKSTPMELLRVIARSTSEPPHMWENF